MPVSSLMGCRSSKAATVATEPSSPAGGKEGPPAAGRTPRMGRGSIIQTPAQVQRLKDKEGAGLSTTDGTRTIHLPGSRLVVKYAFLSQRGYYPDAPDKANQDACCAIEKLGGNPEHHLFGVFDGHGEVGAECATFARDKVPQLLAKDKNVGKVPEHALHATMTATNWQLHRSSIDDTLSGCTACTAFLQGSTLYVANVGDSRCVLAEVKGGKLQARDLTWDQTPFRRDECERVTAAGARVLTLDQLEGLKDPNVPCWGKEEDCDGDPPRLWAPGGVYPGTAFTRSLGDAAAEDSCGVISDPEVTLVRLAAGQPFAILATDGVWEFISSQKAVDIVAACSTPYEAGKAVVAAAYKAWLTKETRTDDITCIVLFFQGLDGSSHASHTSSAAGGSGSGGRHGGRVSLAATAGHHVV